MKIHLKLSAIVLLLCCQVYVSLSQSFNDTDIYVERVLNALTEAILFFDREHRFVNLDAVGWMRMVEAQFTVLVSRIMSDQQNWNLEFDTLSRIRSIADVAGIVSDKAIPHVRRNAPRYYGNLGALLNEGFWEMNYSTRAIPPSFRIFPYRSDEAIAGNTSDNCIAGLLGTIEGRRPCDITPLCWVSMTTPGYFGYSLSHQIYWLQIGEQNGCVSQMENMRRRYGQPSIPDIQTGICANMLAETRLIARTGYQPHRRDLFMENFAFCGMVGFREFFTQESLDRILNWQDMTHGCYRMPPPPPRARGALSRKKRAEVELRHGCLAHLTGVAIGALAQYVRYLLEILSS